VFGQEAVFRNGEPVGYLRRGEYGYYLDKPIGIGYVTNKGSEVTKSFLTGGNYEVEVMGKKYKAKLHLKSPFDPNGQRILGNYGPQGMDENIHEPHAGQNEKAGGVE
jgi:sarcosine dehydrogenase